MCPTVMPVPSGVGRGVSWCVVWNAPRTSLVRYIAIELPDCPPAWEYNRALEEASQVRSDLVSVIITHRSLWEDRKSQLVDVLGKLLGNAPPLSTVLPNIVAMAGLRAGSDRPSES